MDSDYFKELKTGELIHFRTLIQAEITKRRKFNKSCKNKDIEKEPKEITDKQAFAINSTEIRAVIRRKASIFTRLPYYQALILQDWSEVYKYDSYFGDYYVYAHVDPTKSIFGAGKGFGGSFGGIPFYIGKGIGERAWDLSRNEGHGAELRQLLKKGFKKENIVHIVFSGLSEQRALELESKLIYFFGTKFDKSIPNGILVNLDIPKTPKFIGDMVAIKNGRTTKIKFGVGVVE